VRIALQRWFSRICEDPVLQNEDELRSFIESDFGYSPVPPPSSRRQASSGGLVTALSKVVRRGTHDDDDDLANAKITLEKLEPAWQALATSVGNLGKARKALASATSDVGGKLMALATDESDTTLATAERKIGRVYDQLAGMAGAQIASENLVLNDSLAYQALNARVARDALVQRTQILEDSQNATKVAITKRRNVERLKSSSSINPIKVDEAIADMDEAVALEDKLTSHLTAISNNLHRSLSAHSRNAHEDVAVALLEHARMSIIFNRQVLRELEALKPDLARVSVPAASSTVSSPSPLGARGSISAGPPPLISPPVPRTKAAGGPAAAPQTPTSAATPGMAQSMFLPPTPNIPSGPGSADPLAGRPANGSNAMAQSMLLPGRTTRAPPRRLDERKAAKLLAGGF
jgi:hypothetical protein